MYFFGGIAFIAAVLVFGLTFQYVGEIVALGLAAGTWFVVVSIARSVVTADRNRTARKKHLSYQKEVFKARQKYEAEVAKVPPAARPELMVLPDWAEHLSVNRQEWLREKLAEGLAQGEERAAAEQKLKLQMIEWGWLD